MKLVVREYLSSLKESGELDELLPTLMLAMDYRPLSKPQAGRQDGVDIALVGKDDTGRNCLVLLVVKCGNITRSVWDSGPNSIRQTLNEVLDVYLQKRVQDAHKDYVKKIIVCTNGDLTQTTEQHWNGYVDRYAQDGAIEFDLWGGDALSLLIEKHLLNEFILPESSRSDFRKSLALIGESEYDLSHYYRLLGHILFYEDEEDKKAVQAFKEAMDTANLILCILFRWAESGKNLNNCLSASERTVLWGWELIRRKDYLNKTKALELYAHLVATHQRILAAYFKKLHRHYNVRDAVSIYSREHILVTESVFEQIGIVSLVGFNIMFTYQDANAVNAVANSLKQLILNNPSSGSPCYDRHSIEIAIALLFLINSDHTDFAIEWLTEMISRLDFVYKTKRLFPIATDSIDHAIQLSVDYWKGPLVEKVNTLSTLVPMLAQFCCILGLDESYQLLRRTTKTCLQSTNLQLWHPDKSTEEHVYFTPAHYESGNAETSIELPDTLDELKEHIIDLNKEDVATSFLEFSASKHGFPPLLLTASRHFQMPVFPSFWHNHIKPNSEQVVASPDCEESSLLTKPD